MTDLEVSVPFFGIPSGLCIDIVETDPSSRMNEYNRGFTQTDGTFAYLQYRVLSLELLTVYCTYELAHCGLQPAFMIFF